MLTKEINQKIESLFKNKFLGNSLLLNDEEKSILYEYVGDILRNISDSWGEDIRISDYRAVVVALVELTKEWNSDEDAWMDYIASRFLDDARKSQARDTIKSASALIPLIHGTKCSFSNASKRSITHLFAVMPFLQKNLPFLFLTCAGKSIARTCSNNTIRMMKS